jgi:hypothetical protein
MDRQTAAAGAAAVLLPASGFLPWWSVHMRVGDGHATYGYPAWQVSTWWTVAVGVATVAVVAWLACRLILGRMPRIATALALATLTASLFLIIDGRRRVDPWDTAGTTSATVGQFAPFTSEREAREQARRDQQAMADSWSKHDDLRSYHADGLDVDIDWGLWTAVALIAASGALLTLGAARRTP